MKITGHMLIGQGSVSATAGAFKAFSPALAADIEPVFGGAGPDDVDRACRLAASGFARYRDTTPETRASFLEAIALGIEGLGDALVERAMAETALPRARLEGERARTAVLLRLFAGVVRAGHWQGATFDTPLPDRTPLPRPDLRRRNVPLGPVAVFGASNFPLVFSVAGGDTASALAAGCPGGRQGPPRASRHFRTGRRVIQAAVAEYVLPEGTFSLLFGVGYDVGQALVGHPAIRAVGFTGSRAGGLALFRQAMARPVPIPVYAEMSNVNPLLPHALGDRAEGIAMRAARRSAAPRSSGSLRPVCYQNFPPACCRPPWPTATRWRSTATSTAAYWRHPGATERPRHPPPRPRYGGRGRGNLYSMLFAVSMNAVISGVGVRWL
ncbi:aldehyde dehydrogenase family protein [Cupriavidus sp. CuC1]|uniref:aldehyde dehydrogenase family protein n=1 Tax=Cupriavidus sp. CuC1 TaxID=3373131 RepID=UPI0037D0D982